MEAGPGQRMVLNEVVTDRRREGTLDEWLVVGAVDDLEGPVLDVVLHGRVVELAPNQALHIVHRVARIQGHLRAQAGTGKAWRWDACTQVLQQLSTLVPQSHGGLTCATARWREQGAQHVHLLPMQVSSAARLVLGGVAHEALGVGEGDVGGRHPVALVVGDDLHAVVLPDAHAPVGQQMEILKAQRISTLSAHSCPRAAGARKGVHMACVE